MEKIVSLTEALFEIKKNEKLKHESKFEQNLRLIEKFKDSTLNFISQLNKVLAKMPRSIRSFYLIRH